MRGAAAGCWPAQATTGQQVIGVFDRSAPLPTGGYLEQADGTAWMALFCQNMLEIAVELAQHRPAYEDLAGHDDNMSDVATRRYMHVADLSRDP